MKLEKLRKVYLPTPKMHDCLLEILENLDSEKPNQYKRRKNILKVALACGVKLLLSFTTIVASGTNLFGMFSNSFGKYGLDINVYEESTFPDTKGVKAVFGYIPDGYEQIVDGDVLIDVYSYGGNPYCDNGYFNYHIKPASGYQLRTQSVVDTIEYMFGNNKTIIGTTQYEENGTKNYFAVKYFSDYGYVVECYCDKYEELFKIMEKLELEKTDCTERATDITAEQEDVPEEDVNYRITDEFTIVEKGDSFEFTPLFISGVDDVPEFTKRLDNFTIKFKGVEEADNLNALDSDSFSYNSNDEFLANFFDSNGYLITPYTRIDRDNGDGVNTLDKTWETKDDRHFYLVTLEITSNTEYTDFDASNISASIIDEDKNGKINYALEYGNINLIHIENKNEFNEIKINKGETKEIVVGVVCDDDVLQFGCLTFEGTSRKVSDNGDKVKDTNVYYCLKLKDEVDYE